MTDKNIDYENPWIYKGNPFTSDDIGDYYGSSIASPTPTLRSPTSEESTSCRRENPEGQSAESPQSQTGRDIMEVLTNLNETLKRMVEIISEEKSSPSIQPLEK